MKDQRMDFFNIHPDELSEQVASPPRVEALLDLILWCRWAYFQQYSEENSLQLHDDIDLLARWVMLTFNSDMCHMIHFGRSNTSRMCTIDGKSKGQIKEMKILVYKTKEFGIW